MMPITQRCPICHNEFVGTDCIGQPCLQCEMSELFKCQEISAKNVEGWDELKTPPDDGTNSLEL